MTSEELETMKTEFLKTNKIKYIGKPAKKRNTNTQGIISYYMLGDHEHVL